MPLSTNAVRIQVMSASFRQCPSINPLSHSTPSHCVVASTGEVGGDVFILVRGELHILDMDQKTSLLKIPEGTVFGEATVLRHIEVSRRSRAKRWLCGEQLATVCGVEDEPRSVMQAPFYH